MTRTRLIRTLLSAGVIGAISVTAGALYARRNTDAPVVTAEAVTRGSIVRTVAATGTLEAVTTVEVGTQVSGAIQALQADFNSIVKKGQVLARLDPSLYQSAIEQASANLVRANADLERLKVTLADAQVKRDRARELSARQLIPATELDTAEVNVRSAEAQVRSSAAQVTQAQAALRQAQVNVSKTVIVSPIDGIVIARNVDVGQTVAASLSAPTLFLLAARLDEMQLKANIDESDLGVIREGQEVNFTVDAYPRDTFTGVVRQVRLNPVVEQNVVTYAAIISAPNAALKLKPGMTANVTIEVARRDDVLRVPAAALRFRPTGEVKAALGADGVEANGTVVWAFADGAMRPATVTVGVSDGVYTEVSGEGVPEGTEVVTRVAIGEGATATAAPRASSPLMPSGPRR
ncbi:MAG: efflux RND transporter periplasmic adaptor subunit [Vicinamibacterales bacterium]